jgi:hypothetical protein
MWNKVIMAAGAAMAAALAAALGIDIYEHHKVAKKVGISVGELGKATKEQIREELVERAVEDAAKTAVGDYVRRVHDEVMAEAREKIGQEVRQAVNASRAVIEKEVLDKVTEEAGKIDMAELRKSARDKAEAKILEKFDGNLEDLLEKFNDQLSNVQKIYGGIADAITKGKESEKTIKFSI